MGCNLCTLQKREEHYKLLYEIAQVSETGKYSRSRGLVRLTGRAVAVVNLMTSSEAEMMMKWMSPQWERKVRLSRVRRVHAWKSEKKQMG